ncbi:hypothetical protein [Tindallia californiensis]|uniref:Diaminopimelate epimerase n=1 Tax=Tindallia californiensis TaxID=159292 RepID=A0A1H3MHN9_9FIRM|nr:hypothetical protein [Tindallia californiensis]SDY75868.1 diaminopimelate epimerase [Tindallia californiensis]
MKLKYYKCSPTENMTILIWDTVPKHQYVEIAQKLMKENHIHAEQVGFVTEMVKGEENAAVRLEMMGGEFCVNATRSLAAVVSFRQKDEGGIVKLETSGLEAPIDCVVKNMDKAYQKEVGIYMTPPKKVETITISSEEGRVEGTLVAMEGITHVVVNSGTVKERMLLYHGIRKQLKGKEMEALGVMFYDERLNYLEPLVWVRETDSLFWERGCGSGAAALGAVLASQKKNSIKKAIKQPGGTMDITVNWEKGAIQDIYLNGEVRIVSEGWLYI